MIPDPLSDGRLLLVLDDFINPKTGRNIFGCSHIFDHAAKANQSKYPWAQNVVLVGLLKRIKRRWACLPLAHRFYLPKKAILAKLDNMKIPGKDSSFQTKLEQAAKMVIKLAQHFVGANVTVVCDSWFGNNGLFKPFAQTSRIFISFNLQITFQFRTLLYAAKRKIEKAWKTPKVRDQTRILR